MESNLVWFKNKNNKSKINHGSIDLIIISTQYNILIYTQRVCILVHIYLYN